MRSATRHSRRLSADGSSSEVQSDGPSVGGAPEPLRVISGHQTDKRGGTTVGLMTLHWIKEVLRPEWATTNAAQVMVPLEKSKNIEPDTELWAALQSMDRDGVNQLPVIRDRRVVGMLSREDVITLSAHATGIGTVAGMTAEAGRDGSTFSAHHEPERACDQECA